VNSETVAADTEGLDPAPTEPCYAWQDVPDEEPTEAAEGLIPRGGNGLVVAVAVLAAVACVVAVAAAVLMLARPTPQPQRQYVLRPAPVEQMPAPKPPAPKPAPPPVVAAPPVQHVQAPPPDANRRFEALLGQGQMWQRGADDPQQAIELCADLAHGGSPQPYIDGTLKKSPQLLPQEARQVVEDAIAAYCPQYG
jgi:Protein of unknown function (DUF732)